MEEDDLIKWLNDIADIMLIGEMYKREQLVVRKAVRRIEALEAAVEDWKIRFTQIEAQFCDSRVAEEREACRALLLQAKDQIHDQAAMPTDTAWIDAAIRSRSNAIGERRACPGCHMPGGSHDDGCGYA